MRWEYRWSPNITLEYGVEIEHTEHGDKEVKPRSAPHSGEDAEIEEDGELEFAGQWKRRCLNHDDHQCKHQQVHSQQELDECVLFIDQQHRTWIGVHLGET